MHRAGFRHSTILPVTLLLYPFLWWKIYRPLLFFPHDYRTADIMDCFPSASLYYDRFVRFLHGVSLQSHTATALFLLLSDSLPVTWRRSIMQAAAEGRLPRPWRERGLKVV